ncbi:unnamed protein product [Urochloa decumbens]|uniref:F-box domain-containing protein n=1 Tax=Urochloa decumbens TaxID=240449 RepID=A0ABC9FLB3_9POAL
MGVLTRAAKKRRLREGGGGEEEERRLDEDHISRLPEDVLGEIISLLPTKEGGRTQVISSRWRHLWRSAPANLDFHGGSGAAISGILSSHHGPIRRFAVHTIYGEHKDPAAVVDVWLRSPALDNLQELEFRLGIWHWDPPPPPSPLPASARRFSSTLRAACFGGCCLFPDEGDRDAAAGGELHLPVLKQLTLVHATVSERSLQALLAGCPVLDSLLLLDSNGGPRVQIVSPSLRSIGVRSNQSKNRLRQLVIEDAPRLERFVLFRGNEMDISVISAPRLDVLRLLSDKFPRISLGTGTCFQVTGSSIVSLTTVLCSVKVLAIPRVELYLGVAINLMKCFPNLEKLYIKTGYWGKKNAWYRKYQDLIRTLDMRLKKIVLTAYSGNKSHIKFVKFFVSNARVLESMTIELEDGDIDSAWIETQYRMLQIEERASRGVQFDFVYRNRLIEIESRSNLRDEREKVHDLSTTDPFERFPY